MKPLSKLTITFIIIVYACLAFLFSEIAVFNKGPDEETNLAYAEFLITRNRLPVTYGERELIGKDSNWPPLYHLLVSRISRILDVNVQGPPYIKIFWDSFRYRTIDVEGEWYYLRTEDQLWPYMGRVLVLHIGRWLSILFGAITLLLVYRVAFEFFFDKPWLVVATVAILAFMPVFIFMSSVMNEDTMMAALTTLYLWMLILVVKQPNKGWPYLVMGLAMGVSVTVKYTTIILPLEIIIVLAILAWQQGYSWTWWMQRVAIVGGSAGLASSWWFGWNFWYLNEIEERGWLVGLLRPIFTGGPDVTLSRLGYYLSGGEIGLAGLPQGREIGTFSQWVRKTGLSFWGESINDAVALSPYIYILIGIMLGVIALGLWRLWRRDATSRQWLLLLSFHIGIFFILPLLRFALSRRIGETAQGRHILIPAAAAVAILIVWGLAAAIPQPRWRWVFPLIITGFLIWSSAHIYRLIKFTRPPVPMRTVPEAAEWLPHPINVQFGDAIELVSYDVEPQSERGRLRVNLAWRSLAYVKENFLLKVTLLNAQRQIVSHWTGYSGQGRVPTLAWDPGDSIFDRLTLPLINLPAGEYTLQVEMSDSNAPLVVSPGQATRDEIEVENENPAPAMTQLSLTTIVLDRPTGFSFPRNLKLIGEKENNKMQQVNFDMWRADGRVESSYPTYRYPATISIITSFDDVDVVLVDSDGQEWLATINEANIHTFVIGPRWQSGAYRLQVRLLDGDSLVGQVTTEPLLQVENWWERRFETPEIPVLVEANFANQVKFWGYKLPQKQVKAGEAFPITLYWQALSHRSPQADFTQFNDLLSSTGEPYGGYDRKPLEYYNTLLWAPGEVVIDGYAVPVDPEAPPGEYYLNVGYYVTVGESPVNLPLVVNGEMTEVSSVTIGPIQVVE